MFVDFKSLLTDLPGRSIGVEDHSVPLLADVPVRLKPYPLPFSMKEVVEKEVQNMLDMGVIEKSTSVYSSPIVLVKKPDGSVCFCIDFRALRSLMLSRFQIRKKCSHTWSKLSVSLRLICPRGTGRFQ